MKCEHCDGTGQVDAPLHLTLLNKAKEFLSPFGNVFTRTYSSARSKLFLRMAKTAAKWGLFLCVCLYIAHSIAN